MDMVKQAVVTGVVVGIVAPIVIDIKDGLAKRSVDILYGPVALTASLFGILAYYAPAGAVYTTGEFYRNFS